MPTMVAITPLPESPACSRIFSKASRADGPTVVAISSRICAWADSLPKT